MSINVYLVGEKVREIEGFTVVERRGQGNERWNEYRIPGVKLYYEKGRWYTMLDEATDSVPPALIAVVDEISLRKMIPIRPKRETGLYHHESAEAEIVVYGEKHFEVSIRGKKIQDVLDFFRLIKTGSIRPDESYEGEQGGMSRAELEAELKRTQDAHDRRKADLEKFIKKLTKERWPFCTKNKMATLIRDTLYTY